MGLFGFGKKENRIEEPKQKLELNSYLQIPEMVKLVEEEKYKDALSIINSQEKLNNLEAEFPNYYVDVLSIGKSIRKKAIEVCPNVADERTRNRLIDICKETKSYIIPNEKFYDKVFNDMGKQAYLRQSDRNGYNEIMYYISNNPQIIFTEKMVIALINAAAQEEISKLDLIGNPNNFMYKYAKDIFNADSVNDIIDNISYYRDEDEFSGSNNL